MSMGGSASERVLILAPWGRDASIAASVLTESGAPTCVCAEPSELLTRIEEGAALVLVAEEALQDSDLSRLAGWVSAQPAWSDLPFVVLTRRGGGLDATRRPSA